MATTDETNVSAEAPMGSTPPKKKKRSFPSAFTVLFIVLIFAAALTWIVPAGSYDRLTYNDETDQFNIENIKGDVKELPANQATLDKLEISVPLNNFKNGSMRKPIAVPNTYQKIEQRPQGFVALMKASVSGTADSVGIVIFILIMGGLIGVVNATGAFDAGVAVLSRVTKGREFLLVTIISSLIALGGTTFGMAEETIAFYPILVPIFLAAGYDVLVPIAAIYMGSSIGTMFSTTNPFSVVTASNAAGISFTDGINWRIMSLVIGQIISLLYIYWYARKVKKDPKNSLVYEEMPAIKEKFLKDYNPKEAPAFTWQRITILILFASAFPIMIWGVSSQEWWFEELSTLFLTVSILCMIVSGLGEKKAVGAFVGGAADLASVALIVGVARGINMIMDDGMISDTLLYYASGAIAGMNGVIFSTVQMVLFSFLGIFIPSSSGLATLSMPIIAPLADAVHLGRDIVVSAYNYGQGWMSFITPTGLILATLEMVDVGYDKWLKWVLPLMGIIGVLCVIMLALQVVF
ncbi:MAG: YfcC family protein [Aerococcus sp.]|nr:YfcC family protein [Aerococcus sp.]